MGSETQLISNVANSAWQLALAAVALAIISALALRAAMDLGVRASVQRSLLREWFGNGAKLESMEKRLADLGSGLSLYALDYRQICAQLSAAVQYDLSEGMLAPPCGAVSAA